MTWLAWGKRVALLCVVLSACASEEDPIYGGPGVPLADGGGYGDAALYDGSTGFPDGSRPDAGVIVIPGADGGCGAVTAETQPAAGAVDVVWVIDDSFSMLPHAVGVGENMGRFMNFVRMSGAGIEVMMVTGPLIGSALQAAISDPNYHWVLAPVQSHDSFSWTLNSHGEWSKFLRPGAPLHIIYVTDDSSNMPANTFLPMLRARVGRPFTVHAVAADGFGGSCAGAGSGVEYFNAASSTGGERLKLCDQWGAAFDKLQANVVASLPLPCEYPIPPSPDGQSLDPAAVAVVYTPNGGADMEFAKAGTSDACAGNVAWHFDNEGAPSKVVMCPSACEVVKAGGGIRIAFGCAPSIVLE